VALRITSECIACGACDYICPNDAIIVDVRQYRIDTGLCTECKGHFDEPQCIAACPADCILPLAVRVAENDIDEV
jgi:ferredoxin